MKRLPLISSLLAVLALSSCGVLPTSSPSSTSSSASSSASSSSVLSSPSSYASVTYYGKGVPSSDLGQNGDQYYDVANGNTLYIKVAGAWVSESISLPSSSSIVSSEVSSSALSSVISLISSSGNGTTQAYLTGSGAPSSQMGQVGDKYVDLDSPLLDIYEKTSRGWVKQGHMVDEVGQSSSLDVSSTESNSSQATSLASGTSQTSTSSSQTSVTSSQTLSSVSIDTSSPWAGLNFNAYGTTFLNNLNLKITARRKKTASYADNKTLGPKAAAFPISERNKSNPKFIPFYHAPEESEAVTYDVCNREHTWPNSRGAGDSSGAGTDPFCIRPTLVEDNSGRDNKMYSLASEGGWDPASLGYEAARGESARIMFYAAVAWKDQLTGGLTNNTSDSSGNKTMGKLSRLLEWNKQYPVTDMERQINDYLDEQGYGRNPFVDYPDFADYIWNANGLRTSTPGGEIITKYTYSSVALTTTKPLAILSPDGANSASYVYMTTEHKTGASGDLPWYIVGKSAPTSNGKFLTDEEPTWFNFSSQNDGTYTITSVKDNKTLWSYVDGTHYSIQFDEPSASAKSSSWHIDALNGGGYSLYCQVDENNKVYLEYYQSSFCGYSKTAPSPIYFYA